MDISQQYIKMCNGVSEIQHILRRMSLERLNGHLLYRSTLNKLFICNKDREEMHYKHGDIWLPRQDQLQDMIIYETFDESETIISDVLEKFYYFINQVKIPWEENKLMRYSFNSFEQLWLAFYMHRVFQKKFNKETNIWIISK